MAARGSFQKHQKEIARKEKRQQKLDRRQGRTQPGAAAVHDSEVTSETEALDHPQTPESNPAAPSARD